jgi:hypothetical protein
MGRRDKGALSFRESAKVFFDKMNLLQKVTLSVCAFYFLLQSIKCVQLIIQYYGIPGDEWRVTFASVSLLLNLLIVVSPLLAVLYVRKIGVKKEVN